MKIAIIGGGISGLATAFYLKRFSPTNNITIYEAEKEFGGKLKTVEKVGFRIELTSGIFSEESIYLKELIKDADLASQIIQLPETSKIKFFFDKHKLQPIPTNIAELLQTGSIGWFSKISAILDFARPRKTRAQDETLYKFLKRRIGANAANLFGDLISVCSFASTSEKLSAKAGLAWLYELEKTRGRILTDIFDRLNLKGSFFGFKYGASYFVKELSERFANNKKVGEEVSKIKKIGTKWIVENSCGQCDEYDKVILCTPSFVSSRLLREESEKLSELLKNIEYSSLSVVSLGYEHFPYDLNGFGIVSSKRSNIQALGTIWDSSIFENSAPEGKKLIRVLIGGQRHPFLALKREDELLNIATGAISEMMGIYEEPMINHVTRWHKAIPNYDVGHSQLVDAIFDEANKLDGIYLNSSAFRGITLDDCVKNSKETALKIISE